MKIFKPLTDARELIQGAIDNTKEGFEKLMGKGMKGSLKDWFDFSAAGITQKVDFDLGIGILHLTMDGDREAVDTAILFRNELAARIKEIEEMGAITRKFRAEDIAEVKLAAKEMEKLLEEKGITVERKTPEKHTHHKSAKQVADGR